MIDIGSVPFPVTYRELWLPPGINNNAILPASVLGGHPLALTGAQKRTTCDGVHGTGAVTSNVNYGAIHDNVAKFWVSIRFKLDADHAAGGGDRYLWGKRINGDNLLTLYLDNNGMLHFYMRTLAADRFVLTSPAQTWVAGTWYHALASLSDTGGGIQRLLLDGALVDDDTQAAANTPNGGDFVILDLDDPGFGNGLVGIEADCFIGTGDLIAAEEVALWKGISPAGTAHAWLLDEGRGVSSYDRVGANNGTLDTSVTWAWGGCRQPKLSLDGFNDYGKSSAGVNISGGLTVVWVGKMKQTLAAANRTSYLLHLYISATDRVILRHSITLNCLNWHARGNNISADINYIILADIDDYWIVIGTSTGTGVINLFRNGYLVGTATGGGVISGAGATAYIGSSPVPDNFDPSGPIFVGLIEGVFTARQALSYSRWLRDVFNLPINI